MPSTRSWVERTSRRHLGERGRGRRGSARRSAGGGGRSSTPRRSSGPGLRRIESGIASLPTSCSSAASATVRRARRPCRPSADADRPRELDESAEVALQPGVALVAGRGAARRGSGGPPTRAVRPSRRTCRPSTMRSASATPSASSGSATAPYAAVILKPSPCSSSDIAVAAAKASRARPGRRRAEDAELVAADAIDLAVAGRRRR